MRSPLSLALLAGLLSSGCDRIRIVAPSDAGPDSAVVDAAIVDAMLPPGCGDRICDDTLDEDALSCPEDCLDPELCGNERCNYGETVEGCPADCPVLDNCGDGVCQRDEPAWRCPADCVCGDDEICDEPTGFAISGDFRIIDEMDGSRRVEGSWTFELFEYIGNVDATCIQTVDYDATWVGELTGGLEGCDDAGANCRTICPYDDPGDRYDAVGQCVGHMVDIVPRPATYRTDCRFLEPARWFHPDAPENYDLLEQIVYSTPIERDLESPYDGRTWGEAVDEVTMSVAAYAGFQGGFQVAIVPRHPDGSWQNEAIYYGATIVDPAALNDHVQVFRPRVAHRPSHWP